MKYFLSIIAIMLSASAFGQLPPGATTCGAPSVIAYTSPIACSTSCVTLNAFVNGENPIPLPLPTNTYSGSIPIGFTFTYYGVSYNQCIVGANGKINFNLGLAGSTDPWSITAPLLGNVSVRDCICGPWCATDPSAGGTITYTTSGTAPNRRFTVTWCAVPMFGCPGSFLNTQIILYESCNYIDVQVGSKPSCGFNGGHAIIGVQNPTGSFATAAPGRDFPTVYTCTNEAWRFVPGGPASYAVTPITYCPVPQASSITQWWTGATGGTMVGTGNTFSCATLGSTYRAVVAGCGFSSTSIIAVPSTLSQVSTGRDTVCVGATMNIVLPTGVSDGVWSGGTATIATVNPTPAPGTVTGVGVGLTSFTYTYGAGCKYILTVDVKQCGCVDTCYWTVQGNYIHSGNNILGTLSNDDIRIYSNGTQRDVIKANGFFGIKQLSPTTTLDVDGSPTTALSGLRFENLPSGHGNILVVDPNGYVFASPSMARPAPADNNELLDRINQMQQQINDLKAQLSLAGITPDNSAGNSLTATPNPTDGQMNVSYTIASTFSNAVIKITDVQGRLITSRPVNNSTGAVSITLPSSMASGNLVIALIVDGKIVATQKEVLVK